LRPFDAAHGRRLILVRHSRPDIKRDLPAAEWRLSEAGVLRATQFARQLDPGSAAIVFTSEEPKAVETARALASVWNVPVEPVRGLHEHERPAAQMLSRDQFEDRIRQMFARPLECVLGTETAEHARRRFTLALMRVIARSANDVVAVSHGTVMTLFVAEATGVEPFAFWKSLEMPCAVTLTIPDLQITGAILRPPS
jgi:broad specificity phosphatase PhoE